MAKRLVSLIREAKPRRALLTTFTFSLSWFDAIILPALRSVGCTQIDVLVDARKAGSATGEASSLYAGSAYRIIPVFMAKTSVFHPKLAYLETEHVDSLVISSANLTLQGHGRNLEVLDAVDSQNHPAVFAEFAEFLQTLVGAHSFSRENRIVLEEYQQRAAALGRVETKPRSAWLVHTLTRSAAAQFVELAQALPAARTLTVLSPFHSPSGAPIQRLADALGTPKLRIGLDATNRLAPFQKSSLAFKKTPSYVVPRADDADRPLHAKIFEVVGDTGALVMTGSVNATGQSLESTKNVEVSLVRLLPKSPFEWSALAKPDDYQPCEFVAEELSARLPALHVSLIENGRLEGLVTPCEPGILRVAGTLWDIDVPAATFDKVLIEDGHFSLQLKTPLISKGGLRLELSGSDFYAEGWVNVESELSADDTCRALAAASSRILAGEYHPSDFAITLSLLEQLLATLSFRNHTSGENGGHIGQTGTESSQAPVSFTDWSIEQPGSRATGMPARTARAAVTALLHWTGYHDASTAPGHAPTSAAPNPAKPLPSPRLRLLATETSEFANSAPPDSPPPENADAIVQRFLDKLPNFLTLDATLFLVPALVELSGMVCLKGALRHIDSAQNAQAPAWPGLSALEHWVVRFAAFAYSDDNRDKLLPFFSAIACCAAHLDKSAALPALREALNSLAGRDLTGAEIEDATRLALGSNRFARFQELDVTAVLAHAREIAETPTASQQLGKLIAEVLALPNLNAVAVPAEFKDALAALHSHRRSASKAFGVIPATAEAGKSCPCCHVRLHEGDIAQLRTVRTFVCKNTYCQRPLFYGLRHEDLAQYGLGGRYKE